MLGPMRPWRTGAAIIRGSRRDLRRDGVPVRTAGQRRLLASFQVSLPGHAGVPLDSFLVSTFTVALAEMGDKTQLLALVLAARWRKPLVIVAGILVATLANHAAAAAAGALAGMLLDDVWLRWVLAVSFIGLGLWSLIPDEAGEEVSSGTGWGCFWATLVAFFIAEMGDKTQLATVALAARDQVIAMVMLGSTLGLLVANVPVVYAGKAFAGRLPLRTLRIGAAIVFIALGGWAALSA